MVFFVVQWTVVVAVAVVGALTTTVFVNDALVEVQASLGDDLVDIGTRFCDENGIEEGWLRDGRPRCATLIADELADHLYCRGSDKKSFRFYHSTNYFDSEEFELLRSLLLALGYVECLSGDRVGTEDLIWVLGHFSDDAPFYNLLTSAQLTNAVPRPTEIGDKDLLYRHLSSFGGDIPFVPRTWLPHELNASSSEDILGGLWLRKDPQIELGGGIQLIRRWSDLTGCDHCILQRYVDRPLLLNDLAAGIHDAKFSIGVYLALTSVDPLIAWIHREMLVLLCNRPYKDPYDDQEDDVLSHLTNGLLNQRLDGDNYDANERVWTTDRLIAHLEKRGIPWRFVEDQIRAIAGTVLKAARNPMLEANANAGAEKRGARLFSHWRLDFLLDDDGTTWLLEAEIVPSTGTIGGVDEVIKTTVLRDLLALAGAAPTETPHHSYPWLRGTTCWKDTASHGDPPNSVCASPDPEPEFYGPLAEENATRTARELLTDDPLRFDDDALALIGRYEATKQRAGGYRPLYPLLRDVVYFDGTHGSKNGDDRWSSRYALSKDLVLDRWAAVLGRRGSKEEDERVDWSSLPRLTASVASDVCRACLETHDVYCASVAEVEPLLVVGSCQKATAPCVHAPTGLVDGVPLSQKAECDFDNDLATGALLDRSRIGRLQTYGSALAEWCASALRNFDPNDQRRQNLVRLCGTNAPKRSATTPFVAVSESTDLADLADAIKRNKPLVIRNAVDVAPNLFSPNGEDLWKTPVTAMVFNDDEDKAQDIFAAASTLSDVYRATESKPYVLLTDRHRVDPGAGATMADPNGPQIREGGPLAAIHKTAATMMDVINVNLTTAWTSLRFAGRYKYPTHIDCYENILLQLDGVKNLTLFPPETVADLRPDLNVKHWPRGDVVKASRKAHTVELRPGDLAYVPLMWPHNVAAPDWSATANRYFQSSRNSWLNYIDSRKTNAWLLYELQTGNRVC